MARGGVNLLTPIIIFRNVYTNITKAVQMGLLKETELKALVRPLFYTRMRLGEFDPPERNPYSKFVASEMVESFQHQNLATLAASKTFVLLKNEGNTLPVGGIHTLAVSYFKLPISCLKEA